MSAKITQLSNGAEGIFIKNDRFNTTLVSFNFYVPMSQETAAEYALLPFVMTTCSKAIPIFRHLILSLLSFTAQIFRPVLKRLATTNCLKLQYLQ